MSLYLHIGVPLSVMVQPSSSPRLSFSVCGIRSWKSEFPLIARVFNIAVGSPGGALAAMKSAGPDDAA
jgi:hypothetical protein